MEDKSTKLCAKKISDAFWTELGRRLCARWNFDFNEDDWLNPPASEFDHESLEQLRPS